jgi:hypothetical protein
MSNVKEYCANTECAFKPVKFNTFEYMYCTTCKCEVEDDLVERKARYKATLESKKIINPHMDQDDQMDMFDFWSSTN